MDYEWDSAKAESNQAKHSVDFADAVLALEDDLCLTFQDESTEIERRFIAIGIDPFHRLLVVVFTHRADLIRIISARRAMKRERRDYEANR